MINSKEKVAGILLFTAVTQFTIALTIAEALHPGFSLTNNYISDLGIGSSSTVFNLSALLLGLLMAIGTYFLWHIPEFKTASILLFLMAISAIGLGIFTKDFPLPHAAAASAAFFFSGLSALATARTLKKPLSIMGIALGAMTLVALGLYSVGMVTSGSLTTTVALDSIFYLGLGPGGMELMIVYPALMWLASFSGHLAGQRDL